MTAFDRGWRAFIVLQQDDTVPEANKYFTNPSILSKESDFAVATIAPVAVVAGVDVQEEVKEDEEVGVIVAACFNNLVKVLRRSGST